MTKKIDKSAPIGDTGIALIHLLVNKRRRLARVCGVHDHHRRNRQGSPGLERAGHSAGRHGDVRYTDDSLLLVLRRHTATGTGRAQGGG